MEEIKVGEYVRTKEGNIYKITSYDKEANKYHSLEGKFWYIIFPRDIAKHSSNIIGLIEEGDYVNGKLIHKVDIRENSAYIYYGNGKTFCDYQIKDIVTKEQFNQMKYIVGGE